MAKLCRNARFKQYLFRSMSVVTLLDVCRTSSGRQAKARPIALAEIVDTNGQVCGAALDVIESQASRWGGSFAGRVWGQTPKKKPPSTCHCLHLEMSHKSRIYGNNRDAIEPAMHHWYSGYCKACLRGRRGRCAAHCRACTACHCWVTGVANASYTVDGCFHVD